MKNPIQEINTLIAKELSKKPTVKDIEEHTKRLFESPNLTEKQKEFYKGCLRAIAVLRKANLLKE